MKPEQVKDSLSIACIAGSHSYGMATPASDIDIRGICVAPHEYRISISKKFDQTEDDSWIDLKMRSHIESIVKRIIPADEKIDSTIYDVAKAIKLIGDCNPNMLEILFTDSENIIFCDRIGEFLVDNKHLFLSLKAKDTYTGYAQAQLKKIQRHRKYLMGEIPKKPNRSDFGLPDHESVLPQDQRDLINEQITARIRTWGIDEIQMDAASRLVLNENLRSFMCDVLNCEDASLEDRLEDTAASSLGIDDSVRRALHAERTYRHKLKEYKSYKSWKKERNPKRQALEAKWGFDTKHASHLIRLSRTGVEILETRKLNIKRDDAQELLDIRNGKRSYDSIVEEADRLKSRMIELKIENPYNLPATADKDQLDNLYQKIFFLEM